VFRQGYQLSSPQAQLLEMLIGDDLPV
jgi:hypothetical protein